MVVPYAAPSAVPVAAPRSRRAAVGRWFRTVAISVVVCVVAALVGLRTWSGSSAYPSTWDPRIAEIVRFVERARGVTFVHPVRVYFLTSEQYTQVSTGGGEPSSADRREARNQVRQLRSLGLVSGSVDLLGASSELADSGTLAFYDPVRDVVNVRGRELTPSVRVTLAHELTHVLQDQRHDLAAGFDQADSSDAQVAWRAVVEGDAMAVEDAYVSSLPEDERDQYEQQAQADADNADSKLDSLPQALSTLFGLPYALGGSFISLLDSQANGSPLLERAELAFSRRPTSTGELFTAINWFDRVPIQSVRAPSFDDATEFDPDVLGAASLYVILSERIDPLAAMQAVDGWRGDRMRSALVNQDGAKRYCTKLEVRQASDDAGEALRDAFSTWAAAMPAEATVEVSGSGTQAKLETCDPGRDVTVTLTGQSAKALGYLAARLQLAAREVTEGAARSDAWCIADAVTRELTLDEVSATTADDEFMDRLDELTESARSTC